MSIDRFLPPTKNGEAIPGDRSDSKFSQEQISLLSDISENMLRGEPKTKPRRPTPFSSLWQFAADLNGESSSELEKVARRRLRGLLATIALRGRYGIDLKLKISPRFGEDEAAGVPFVAMLRKHRNSTPKGMFSDDSILSFAIGDRIVAGFSPLTLTYPAAKRSMVNDSICPPWLLGSTCEWLDPTVRGRQLSKSDKEVPDATVGQVRPMMKKWVARILELLKSSGQQTFPVIEKKQLLIRELESWQKELQNENDSAVALTEGSIATVGEVGQQTTELVGSAFFSTILEGAPESSLTKHRGKILLTLEDLSDGSQLIYGNVRGGSNLAEQWKHAPVIGDHLGKALKLPASEEGSLATGYIMVDKLFHESIHQISEIKRNVNPVSSDWSIMEMEDGSYFLPFKEEILEVLSIDEIRKGFSCAVQVDERIEARLAIGNRTFLKLYNRLDEKKIRAFDRSLDFRLFPSYDLSTVSDSARMLPKEDDKCYHTRIRGNPSSDQIEIVPVLSDSNDKGRLAGSGDYENFDEKHESGLTKRHRIFGRGEKLSGFVFNGLGMVLVDLPKATQSNQPSPRIISIDFGTSNSCVGRQNADFKGEPHRPDPNVTSIFKSLIPVQYGQANEGHAALFDFFPLFQEDEERLYVDDYFPTQITSREELLAGAQPKHSNGFNPRNGLICFKSVSEMLQENPEIVETISEFATGAGSPATIYLRDRIKWGSEYEGQEKLHLALRRLFHQHLRLQLIHHSARRGEFINEVRGSYPRAFTNAARGSYKQELEHVWIENGKPAVGIQTESAAAAAHIGAENMEDHFLIDIGGGTSDVCLFADGKLQVESSFRLASDKIDRVILSPQSEELRRALVREVKNDPKLSQMEDLVEEVGGRFIETSVTSDQFDEGAITARGLLYAILGLANCKPGSFDNACENIAEGDLTKRSVQTLFHTVLFLFGGLSYFAGRMYRSQLGDTQPSQRRARISFVGNGSKHGSWLGSINESEIGKVLSGVFRQSAGLGGEIEVEARFLDEPKASVANGLATGGIDDQGFQETAKVFNDVNSEWAESKELDSFYRDFEGKGAPAWSFESSALKDIAEAIESSIKDGRIGGRQILTKHEKGWALALCGQSGVGQRIGNRLMDERATFKDDLEHKKPGLGLEPLEIAELAGFLNFLNSINPDA